MKTKSQMITILSLIVLASMFFISNTNLVYAMAPHRYGHETMNTVCGDQLCNKVNENRIPAKNLSQMHTIQDDTNHAPSVEIEQIYQYDKQSTGSYIATIKLTAGDMNLSIVKISLQSDFNKIMIPINGIFAHDSQIIDIRTHASDPKSIVANISSWQYNE